MHHQDPHHAENHDQQSQHAKHTQDGNGIQHYRIVRQDGKIDQQHNADEDAECLPAQGTFPVLVGPDALVKCRVQHRSQSDSHAASGEQAQRVVGDVEIGDVLKPSACCALE